MFFLQAPSLAIKSLNGLNAGAFLAPVVESKASIMNGPLGGANRVQYRGTSNISRPSGQILHLTLLAP